VKRSKVLASLVENLEVRRGRFYLWRDETDLMARTKPQSSAAFLLEAPRGNGWVEHARGTLRVVLGALERDRFEGFHGMGALARKGKVKECSVQAVLHRQYGIPLSVVAEPREWYELRRRPESVEHDAERGRVLVRFAAIGPFGSFGGARLYARRNGEWGAYTVAPSASSSIASAEQWLARPSWECW